MFGIKTKKDKKIKELQKEIDRLKIMLIPTRITYQNADAKTLCSEYTLPIEALEAIPEEHIKKVLANEMLEAVEENMEIEYTTDKFRQLAIYTAKLKIVKIS